MMAAWRDRRAREAAILLASLVMVEAEIARFQAPKALLDEILTAVQHCVEEIDLQMEQERSECEERSRQLPLLKTSAARIRVKEIIRQIIFVELDTFLNCII